MNNRWFANRGQVIQTVLAVIACIFAGVKVFPDFQRSQFFTIGSLVFIFIAASVVVSFVQFVLTVRSEHQKADILSKAEPAATAFSGQYRGKLFSCSSGLSRIGKKADGVWTPVGSVQAAVATFKNESNKTLKNVEAFAHFYDERGREIASSRLFWIDEEHDNTGFATGETRSLLIAVQAKETDRSFSVPDDKPLKEGNTAVKLNLIIDNGEAVETMHFNLSTEPYIGLTPVKP